MALDGMLVNSLKNKLTLFTPVIIAAILIIFGAAMIPSINPSPTNLPIALVNEDEGLEVPGQDKINMGEEFTRKILESSEMNSDQDPVVKWIRIDSKEQVQEGLGNQEYYAALVIPKDFSPKQASLLTLTPANHEVTVLVNQEAYPSAVSAASQTLNGIVDNLNTAVRSQLLEGFDKQDAMLTQNKLRHSPIP